MALYNLTYFVLPSLIINLCFTCASVRGVLKPRGVPLSRKIFYDASQNFSCLDGSGIFPFHFVNDDYCDCPDGSDEPGTAACPDGVFFCLNHGHLSTSLPSSRVNDGICDCCDTTDEYKSVADCFDNCKEQGIQAFSDAKAIYEEHVRANELREMYISEAKIQREKYMSQLQKLTDDELKAMKIKLKKQDLKDKAEEKESTYLGLQKQVRHEQEKRRIMEMKLLQEHKEQEENNAKKAFLELDINKDGKVTVSEVRSFPKFDYDGDGKVSEMEAKFYMQKKEEMVLAEFLQIGWRTMKPAFMIEEFTSNDDKTGLDSPASISTSENKLMTDVTYSKNSLNIDDKDKYAVFEDAAVRRKEYADSEKILQDIQANVWLLKQKLNTDYGTEDEFFILQDKCFDYSDKRYLYRICPFDKALQIMKHNQDETLLGLWNTWLKSDGKYTQMSYTRGLTCWNGPARSVLVNLRCGLENKVLSVVENSPCQYLFELATPAACKDLPRYVEKVLRSHLINL